MQKLNSIPYQRVRNIQEQYQAQFKMSLLKVVVPNLFYHRQELQVIITTSN